MNVFGSSHFFFILFSRTDVGKASIDIRLFKNESSQSTSRMVMTENHACQNMGYLEP